MQTADIPTHWLLIEAFGVTASFVMYHLLALKKREGWLVYVAASFAIIYLMIMKDSWITVINQLMMIVLGFKNYFVFGQSKQPLYGKALDWLSLPVYLGSFFLLKDFSFGSITEVLMWGVIIAKTLTLGKGQSNGWIWQILQQILSIVFGWQREIYLYVLKSVFQLLQGVWGYWRWRGESN